MVFNKSYIKSKVLVITQNEYLFNNIKRSLDPTFLVSDYILAVDLEDAIVKIMQNGFSAIILDWRMKEEYIKKEDILKIGKIVKKRIIVMHQTPWFKTFSENVTNIKIKDDNSFNRMDLINFLVDETSNDTSTSLTSIMNDIKQAKTKKTATVISIFV